MMVNVAVVCMTPYSFRMVRYIPHKSKFMAPYQVKVLSHLQLSLMCWRSLAASTAPSWSACRSSVPELNRSGCHLKVAIHLQTPIPAGIDAVLQAPFAQSFSSWAHPQATKHILRKNDFTEQSCGIFECYCYKYPTVSSFQKFKGSSAILYLIHKHHKGFKMLDSSSNMSQHVLETDSSIRGAQCVTVQMSLRRPWVLKLHVVPLPHPDQVKAKVLWTQASHLLLYHVLLKKVYLQDL